MHNKTWIYEFEKMKVIRQRQETLLRLIPALIVTFVLII
jgi:hypothetical protein